MRRVNPPVTVSVRRNGFRIRTIARLKFEAGPQIAGWVNYRGKVYPLFQDPGGALFLDEDGGFFPPLSLTLAGTISKTATGRFSLLARAFAP